MTNAVSYNLRMAQFGAFHLDLLTGELRKHGSPIRLQEQPFQILKVLLERRGVVVTRDELRERLWPADTYVEFDKALNSAMNRLRQALGESAESPRFVHTVSRRGYRFVGPVEFFAWPVWPPVATPTPARALPLPEPIPRAEPRESAFAGRIAIATGIVMRRIGSVLYRWSDLFLSPLEKK